VQIRVIITTTELSAILFGKYSQIAIIIVEGILITPPLPLLTGQQGPTNPRHLLPVHRHLHEAVEAAVREVAVGAAAAEAVPEAGHPEVTKRFINE